MRKSGSAVLLLLGYANSVDAMTRVRREWNLDWFDEDTTAAGDATTATTTTTADPFSDSFFNDSDVDTFGASAVINVEGDVQVESETQAEAEAEVEVEADGQVKIGARAWGGPIHGMGGIQDRPTAYPTTQSAQTTQKPTTRTVHTHGHQHTSYTHTAHTCDNGGTWNHTFQRCDCPAGFGGLWCNQKTTCPTCYRGSCQVTNGIAKCVCEAGWSLSDCRRHSCSGHGHSEVVNGQAGCNCQTGWIGEFCQTQVPDLITDITDNCYNGHLSNGRCLCDANWYGRWCTEYRPQRSCSRDCGNGDCRMGTTSANDYCVCNPGFSGSNCNTEICKSGFAGPNCDTEVCTGRCPNQLCKIVNNRAQCYNYVAPSCNSMYCQRNQHCQMVGSVPRCTCNVGYSGSNCNVPTICATKVCGANMTCYMNGGTPECTCNSGYYLSGSSCVYIPPSCSNTACGANMSCSIVGGNPTCTCNTGYTQLGTSCVYNQPTCETTLCGANMTCRMIGSTPTCTCNAGYLLSGTSCVYIPPTCSSLSCNAHQRCIVSNGMPKCICKTGWTGDHCNIQSCTKQCTNGSCQIVNGVQSCECYKGYYGANCDQQFNSICDKKCGSHGVCVGSGINSSCQCKDNYSGEHCNIKPCPDNCNGRGACSLGKCNCIDGWSGAACQNQVCTLDCGANGNCAFSTGGQYCQCKLGYGGQSCTKLICDLNCNNGQCMFNADFTSKSCVCSDGYSGPACDISDITPCNTDGRGASPCHNGCQCNLKTPGQCEDCQYTCTNTNGNSFLGGKCQYQEPTLTCMTEMIQIQVDQALIEDWEQNKLSTTWGATLFHGSQFNARQCQFNRLSNANSDYSLTISAADWAKCGGSVSVQNGMLTVSNKVSRDVTHDVISFEEPVFDWTCQYQIAVSEGVVGPPPPRNPIQIVENHNFNIKMNFYCDPRTDVNRKQLETLGGNNVIMTDQVFVNIDLNQLNQFQHLPKMGMRLGDCVAETGFGDQAQRFTIIKNGCPTSLGLTEMVVATDSEVEFKFNNFIDRRLPTRRSTLVKITCQISMCGSTCGAMPVCSSRRRRGIPEIDSELELLESDLFEESEILSPSDTEENDELSIKNIELYDTVFYMDIEDIIPMQNSTKIITEN